MKNFALTGAAGYIASRHIEAIKMNHGNLLVAHDPSDSVGILDRFYTDVEYFKRYDDFCSFIKSSKNKVDYLSICSPNVFHKPQI